MWKDVKPGSRLARGSKIMTLLGCVMVRLRYYVVEIKLIYLCENAVEASAA
jgi:hypothetical protein